MLRVSEALQRELVILAVMLERPSFEPLEMLVGKLKNPCLLAEVWKVKGVGSGPIHIAGNQTLVAQGDRYATNEGCSIAGTESYEGRRKPGNHACLHRGAKSGIPKMHLKVGIPEWNATMEKWMQEQEGMSHESASTVQKLLEMTPEWWSRCQVRMRWEMLEQQSERERESVICIRFEQTRCEDTVSNRQTSARAVEEDILTLVNLIREQCFQQAETFISGDIRYQGFEDQDGLGKGMITMRRRTVEVFEIDISARQMSSQQSWNAQSQITGKCGP
jgi:hypothetical protein